MPSRYVLIKFIPNQPQAPVINILFFKIVYMVPSARLELALRKRQGF